MSRFCRVLRRYRQHSLGHYVRCPGNVAHHDVNHRFKKFDVLNLVALHDVLDVNCAEEAAQILLFLFRGWLERTFGKPSIAYIFLKNGKGIGFGRTEIPVFGKRKRRCLNYLPASAKFRGNIGNEKLGVGACNVGIYVRRRAEPAEYTVERDDGHAFLSVFMFMGSSEKMKLDMLYHHSEDNAILSC